MLKVCAIDNIITLHPCGRRVTEQFTYASVSTPLLSQIFLFALSLQKQARRASVVLDDLLQKAPQAKDLKLVKVRFGLKGTRNRPAFSPKSWRPCRIGRRILNSSPSIAYSPRSVRCNTDSSTKNSFASLFVDRTCVFRERWYRLSSRGGLSFVLGFLYDVESNSLYLSWVQVECLMAMGKHDEAYAMSSALIRHSQNNPALLITRARCLYLNGNLDSAVKHLQVRDSHDLNDVSRVAPQAGV